MTDGEGASSVPSLFTDMQMGGSSEDEDAIPAAAAAAPAVAAAERGKPTGALALAPAPDRTLAPGWERLESAKYPGRFFFYNAATEESTWEAPAGSVVAKCESVC